MVDDAMMRYMLQRVLAYRELCRAVRSSGRSNVFFAALFFYFAYTLNGAGAGLVVIVYGALAAAEIGVGLFKWVFPSAEGILLDAILLFGFAGLNLTLNALAFAAGLQPNQIGLLLGVLLLVSSIRRFKNYLDLRKAFADRPTSDQMRWFDDLIYEIKHADPATDDLALDLPTRPHWKAKLLGTTAFFVLKNGTEVIVAGPWDFALISTPSRDGPDARRVRLQINDRSYKPFEIDEASLANYSKWIAEHQKSFSE